MNTIETKTGEGRKQIDNGRNYLNGTGYTKGITPELLEAVMYSEGANLSLDEVKSVLRRCN